MQDRADYGYSELNPVVTTSSSASERYLAALRTERGEGLRWIREGTLSVKKLNDRSNVNVECYTLYLYGKEYKKLYVCPSGRRNSNDAPKGLILSTDGKKLSYNGSISLEASEKGISEEHSMQLKRILLMVLHMKIISSRQFMIFWRKTPTLRVPTNRLLM